MGRAPRRQSESGLYHAITRGVNREAVFHDPAHYERYLDSARKARDASGAAVLAYALMPNHAHFLIHDPADAMQGFFQRLGTGYATWYNRKHDRVGHLFQGRFNSKPIDTDAYLAMALTYIHMNPVKAGLSGSAADYPWSSASHDAARHGLADPARLAEFIEPSRAKQYLRDAEALAHAADLPAPLEPVHLAIEPVRTEDEAISALLLVAGVGSHAEFMELPLAYRRAAAAELAAAGLSPHRAGTLAGVS
ncbi:MAG: transposase, partial [Bifidobacteriaceae bacterium]|nr:transposase [Bifidobacteriaceae bacterium]